MIISQDETVFADDKSRALATLGEFLWLRLLLTELWSEKLIKKGMVEHIFRAQSPGAVSFCGLFNSNVDYCGF